jgi:signal transduction histidine kinase
MSYPDESHKLAYKLTQLIRSYENTRSLVSGVAKTVGQTFDADLCLFVAGTSARPGLLVGYWDGNDAGELPFEIAKPFFSQFPIADILAKTEPFEIADLQANLEITVASWLEKTPLRSLLGLTTTFQNTPNGILMVGYLPPHQWTTQEHELLQAAAEVGGIASHVAQLDKVTKINAGRESLSVNKPFSLDSNQLFRKWYELTHQQLEQQRQLNQLKDEIITAISDRARNPLATMKLAMEMLSKDQNKPLPPESQERYWSILKQEWQRLNDLINNIVTLKKLESHEVSFNPETISLTSLASDLAQSFQNQWQQDKRKQITTTVREHRLTASEEPLTIYTDPQHLKSILIELLTNAGNYSLPEKTVAIDITEGENQLAIAVSNISRGISEQEKAYIFEPFRRGEDAIEQSIPGVGLGLSLVKKLVELLNGKIEVASHPTEDPDAQTISFTLTLPHFLPQRT